MLELQAYCINLTSERKRKEHCIREYEKLGVKYSFIEAFDGRIEDIQPDAPLDQLQALRWKLIDETALTLGFFNRGTNSAERACAKSHFKVWEIISKMPAEKADTYFMVNEDDFNIASTVGLKDALEELKILDFDLVYIGYRGGDYKSFSLNEKAQRIWHHMKWAVSDRSNAKKFRKNLVLLGKARIKPKSSFFHDSGMTWGGHAYLLNPKGAQRLMRYNENLRFLPDEAFRYALLDEGLKVGMSKVKYFGCDTQFGSALRSSEDHAAHHAMFPSD